MKTPDIITPPATSRLQPVPVLSGLTVSYITTDRLTTRVLIANPRGETPVLFLHGNLSSATWWEEILLTLPPGFIGIAPDQRGFGDADHHRKIDARSGLLDLAEDALALIDFLGYRRFHVIGSSLGGSVVWRLLEKQSHRLLSATLVGPGSPWGFGGTKDAAGTPCSTDFAGSGAGLVNGKLIDRIAAGDSGMDSPFSPRTALRTMVLKPPFLSARENALVAAMLRTHCGLRDLPGDVTPSTSWPYFAPGRWGAVNALSPRYAGKVASIPGIFPKPHILWIRGSHDLAIGDECASDPALLGEAGIIPEWPGNDIYPPQPMLQQIRHILSEYARTGGRVREEVIENTGHAPYLERPDLFNTVFHANLARKL